MSSLISYNTNSSLKNNSQFYDLFKNNYKNLFSLLYKFAKTIKNTKALMYDIKKVKTDKDIYDMISKLTNIKISDDQKIYRAINKSKGVVRILPALKYNSYLDIGASDCLITEQLGIALKIPQENVYGIDIEDWSGKRNEKLSSSIKCNFKTFDGLNIPDLGIKFSLISLFQVMHHVQKTDRKKFMINVFNSIDKNGILIIREHDCKDNETSKLIDVEHGIWDNSINKTSGFYESYYGDYGSHKYWDDLFISCGFVLVKKYFENKSYYVENIKINGNPTNYYNAIYQKK